MEGAAVTESAHPYLCRFNAMRNFAGINLERVVADVLPYGGDQHYVFDVHLTRFVEVQRHRPLA
jgi:hypothetical protein